MSKIYSYISIVIGLLLFALTSCEKIIEIELDRAKEMLVVDALLSNLPKQSVVRLSKSTSLFSKESYKNVSGAVVSVFDQSGNSFKFIEVEQGIYKNNNFIGIEGTNYQLEINFEDINVKATSKMPNTVPIDSIEVIVSQTGFMGNKETRYSLKVFFTDPADETNYYRFDVYKNDSLYDGFVVSNDLFYNGITTYQFFMNYNIKPSDSICVQLSCIDKANYSYFQVLSQGDSPFIIAPGNPVSNLKGNVIGYFGAYAQTRKSIIVPSSNLRPKFF